MVMRHSKFLFMLLRTLMELILGTTLNYNYFICKSFFFQVVRWFSPGENFTYPVI
jgi:hypothetical protein